MPDLRDGVTVRVQGSGREPYILKNVGGVYSCSCPAWRNQSRPIDLRSCKHLRQLRGAAAEAERIGEPTAATTLPSKTEKPVIAPKLLLAHAWDNEQDLTGWYMSEKLDGVRAYWDGNGRFLSRQGNPFHAPAWFTAGLPTFPLDGELWIDRKAFQKTVSIVRRQDAGDLWRQVRYVVFDMPAVRGTFEERLRQLRRENLERWHFTRVLYQDICQDVAHLRTGLDRIEGLGGEGLMLRHPDSLYEAGRSHTLLKVKRFHDAEACVIEHLPGAGRHRGRMGALLVSLADGTQFHVGTGFSDAERESPPPVGSRITFRYQELTDGGVPRFPSFVRVRPDSAI